MPPFFANAKTHDSSVGIAPTGQMGYKMKACDFVGNMVGMEFPQMRPCDNKYGLNASSRINPKFYTQLYQSRGRFRENNFLSKRLS